MGAAFAQSHLSLYCPHIQRMRKEFDEVWACAVAICLLSSLAIILIRKRDLAAFLIRPRHEITCLRRLANNKGSDQPAQMRSLISTYVICFLENFIYELAKGEIFNFSS